MRTRRARTLATMLVAFASSCGSFGTAPASGVADAGSGNEDAAGPPAADARPDPVPGSYRDLVIEDKPVVYFRFEELAGAPSVREETTRTAVEAACTLGEEGVLRDSRAARFADEDHKIEPDVQFSRDGTNPFTLEAWIRAHDIRSNFYGHIVTQEQDSPRTGYALVLQGNEGLIFERHVGGVRRAAIMKSHPVVEDGPFVHVAGTYDGAALRLFINGVLAASEDDDRSIVQGGPNAPVTIGSRFGTADRFIGWIDEAAVYDKAVDPARLLLHSRAGSAR